MKASQGPVPRDARTTEVNHEVQRVPRPCTRARGVHRPGRSRRARPRTAEWDAGAVLTTVADTVSGGELNQIISRLPSGYAVPFGEADLAG
nr:DUF2267 domain-containing protein [Streptomyces sp. NRRL S-340]